jgi:hypothetical protein
MACLGFTSFKHFEAPTNSSYYLCKEKRVPTATHSRERMVKNSGCILQEDEPKQTAPKGGGGLLTTK